MNLGESRVGEGQWGMNNSEQKGHSLNILAHLFEDVKGDFGG